MIDSSNCTICPCNAGGGHTKRGGGNALLRGQKGEGAKRYLGGKATKEGKGRKRGQCEKALGGKALSIRGQSENRGQRVRGQSVKH